MARLAAGARLGRFAARAARRYAARLYRGFDLVLAPSRSMRNHLLDWGVERVALQPLGVDTAAFHPERAAATSWRAGLGLAADARVLVYAGRFAPEKHLDVLAARWHGSVRRTSCWRSATGRCHRRHGCASSVHRRRHDAGLDPGRRRCLRACRRPGDLRPVGARGHGLRHADRRAPG
jgi:hypothetical protein